MECSKVKDILYEYIYNELNEADKNIVSSHIENCNSCNASYIELKNLLIDDMQDLILVKNKINVPIDINKKIISKLNKKSKLYKLNISKYLIAACLLISLIFSTPVLAYYITQVTPIQKYIELDDGVIKNFEEGKGQLIEKSYTMNNITLTVDGLIQNSDTTSILLSIKVPKDNNINYGLPTSSLGSIKIYDQFGFNYRVKSGSMSVKSVNNNGEAQCIFDIERIKFWSYKLNIRLTAIELGNFIEDTQTINQKKNAYGNWHLSFYINRKK